MDSARALHLSFDDHFHEFDSAQENPGAAKILEPQHGSRASLDRPMVLLDEVIELFRLVDLDRRFTLGIDIDGFECGEICAAFVGGHCLGHAILVDRFVKIALGRSLLPLALSRKLIA